MDAKVSSVESVCLNVNKSNPPQLVAAAKGLVNSSGWSDGRLVPWLYVMPPEDGIQDFDFIAKSPDGMVLWVELPITASLVMEMPGWLKGVRVHAATNAMEAKVGDPSCSAEIGSVPVLGVPMSAGR